MVNKDEKILTFWHCHIYRWVLLIICNNAANLSSPRGIIIIIFCVHSLQWLDRQVKWYSKSQRWCFTLCANDAIKEFDQ